MTVRTKAGLASQIAALLADNDLRDITEGDARSVVTDIVDSMALESALTPGAAGSGMPTFSAGALTYDGAANEITGDLTNFAAMPPLPSLIVAIMPADIDRQAEDLRMTLNLRDFALLSVLGDPVAARDLTPGCAHLILRASTGYRLLDPLGVRPQDWVIRSAWSDGDRVLTEAEIAAGTAGTAGDTGLTVADSSVQNAYIGFGVPDTTPDITRIFYFNSSRTHLFQRVAGTVNDPNGAPYKWWVSLGLQNSSFLSGDRAVITQ